MLRVSRNSDPASRNARFIQALAAKSLETVRLTEALSISPVDGAARSELLGQLSELRLSATELGFVHLEAALSEALERLDREAFAPAALVAVRVLAWRYESLAAMPGVSGTHPVVAEEEVAEAPTVVEAAATSSSLRGRRILVADDEAEVRWFYVGVLREASARVLEAGDGVHALEIARRQVPDVILADIVMPRLDGLGLCAAIRREPRLDGVPVVLLSWREDYLHRMRELRAEAQGYLRKEVPAREILGRVSRVLAPLTGLERSLKSDQEVSGDLEELGAAGLFRAVRRFRPSSCVVLQDPWSLFEVELRDGRMMAAARTAIDGAISHGVAALPALVGMISGRFVVAEAGERNGGGEEAGLDPAFEDATRHLGLLLNRMAERPDCRVEFDEDLLGTYLRHSPVRVQQLIARLVAGETPEALCESGAASRTLVDALLVTLARQGAIREVRVREPAADERSVEISVPDLGQELNAAENQQESASMPDPAEREDVRAQSAVAMHREPANQAPAPLDPIWRMSAGTGARHHDIGSRFEMEMQTTPRLIGLGFLVLFSLTVAFLIWNQIAAPAESTAPPTEPRVADSTSLAGEPSAPPERPTEIEPAAPEPSRPPADPGLSAFSGTLRVGVDPGLSVGAEQGVLELTGPNAVRVDVDDVDRGPLPVTLVLEEGIHRVRYRHGLGFTDRFYYVKSGATRVLHVVTHAAGFVDPR